MKMRAGSMDRALKFKARLADPEFRIVCFVAGWEQTGSPVYLWKVISICSEHGKPLPPAVTDYLAQVAQRMDDAKSTKDLREVLPAIIGFPARKGPSRPLNPGAGGSDPLDRLIFTHQFYFELQQGRTVSEALKNATGHASLPPRFADADEKTLKKWIGKAIGLKGALPRTAEEWQSALRSALSAFSTGVDDLLRE
jgi:hypothetical protein